MNLLKRTLSLSLALLLALSLTLTACGGKQEVAAEPPAQETPAQEAPVEAPVTTRIAALKGPTAMGLVKLMNDDPQSADGPMYDFTLAGAADEVTPLLIKGELDMACVPPTWALCCTTRPRARS